MRAPASRKRTTSPDHARLFKGLKRVVSTSREAHGDLSLDRFRHHRASNLPDLTARPTVVHARFPTTRHIHTQPANAQLGKRKIVGKIGEGTTGVVYVVEDPIEDGGRRYAMKGFKASKSTEGVSVSAMREIGLLRELRHRNVIGTTGLHIAKEERAVFLSLEFAGLDLQHLLRHHVRSKRKLEEYTIKSVMWQILRGLQYLHANGIMHRDIKPSNVLMITGGDDQGLVKLADFGLARAFGEAHEPLGRSGTVVTMWYRAPELLLGAEDYSPAIDMWAAGCIFGELFRLRPLFCEAEIAGSDAFQLKQMQSIIKALGRPHATKWPALAKLKRWKKNEGDIQNFKPNKREARDLGALLKLDAGSQALRLIGRMLEYDPSKRLTAAEALEDEYFRTPPFAGHNCFCDGFPTEPKALPYADRTRKKQKQQRKPSEAKDQPRRASK